jgi:hypothetical protein
LPVVLSMFDDRECDIAVEAFKAASMTLQQHPRLRGAVVRALQHQARTREPLRDQALDTISDIQVSGPAEGTIDDAKAEAVMAEGVRALRNGAAGRLSFGFQLLLTSCLRGHDEWDPQRVPDGLVEITTKFTKRNTLDVRAQMTCLNSRGQSDCLDPFHATITIDPEGTTIRRALIEYGDAEKGIGAARWGSRGVDPRRVTNWIFRFVK